MVTRHEGAPCTPGCRDCVYSGTVGGAVDAPMVFTHRPRDERIDTLEVVAGRIAAALSPGRTLTDAQALDGMARLLSAPKWPGASGMEDIAAIVLATGRPIKDDPSVVWERH